MMVSLPSLFGDRWTDYLDRIRGGFYGGFVLYHRQEQKQRDSAPVSTK